MVAVERVPRDVVRAVDLPLLGFVLGLGLIVRALGRRTALGDLVADVLPDGDGLLALLGATLLAAVLANLLNNVPALLVLLPAAAAGGPGDRARGADRRQRRPEPHLHRLARDAAVAARAARPRRGAALGEFHRLGALTVPPILVLGTVALWLA